MNTIRRYRTEDGHELVTEWLDHLKDRQAKARIHARIERRGQTLQEADIIRAAACLEDFKRRLT